MKTIAVGDLVRYKALEGSIGIVCDFFEHNETACYVHWITFKDRLHHSFYISALELL